MSQNKKRRLAKSIFAHRYKILALAVLGVEARPASALTIIPTFTSSVISLSNATTVESAVNYAISQLENVLTVNSTVNIAVVATPGTGTLGESLTQLDGPFNYSGLVSALKINSTTAATSSAYAALPASDPTNGSNFYTSTSEARALGQTSFAGNDGTFVFGAGLSYTFSPTNRAVSGEFDFIGVAEHEMTEIMGRIPGLGNKFDGTPDYTANDLFRYTGPGALSLSSTATGVYFSDNGGQTLLKPDNSLSSGDLDDWAENDGSDSFNAFTSPGIENDISPQDVANMDVLGYQALATARTLTWDGTSNSFLSSHWQNSGNLVPSYIGAALQINTGGQVSYTPQSLDSFNINLSNTSIFGNSLTINQGTFLLNNAQGISGHSYYVVLDNGGSLSVSGAVTYSGINPVSSSSMFQLDGGFILASTNSATASASFSGGINQVGLNAAPDPSIYDGDFGAGTITQSNTAFVSTAGSLNLGAQSGSSGTYNLQGGVLKVTNGIYIGGMGTGGAISPGGTGQFNLSGGTATAASMAISSSGTFNQTGGLITTSSVANANTLSISAGTATLGTITGTGTTTLGAASGSGASVSASSITQNSLTINNTGKLTLTGATVGTVGALAINGNGTLDLTTTGLLVTYSGPVTNSPQNAIRNDIINGYNGGSWNGTGITSSTAAADAANPSDQYKGNAAVGYGDNNFLGRTDIPTDSVLVRFTYYGDSDLNGVVNLDDFSDWLAGFQDPHDNPDSWLDGDYLYEGNANLDDFSVWLSSFQAHLGSLQTLEHEIQVSTLSASQQQSLMTLIAAVPEPSAVGLLLTAPVLLARRRKSRRACNV